MMFKKIIKKSFGLSLFLRWLKKLYVSYVVLRKGYYFAQENSALQSSLIPLFRGYCLWKHKGEVKIKFKIGNYVSDAELFENNDLQSRYPNLNSTGYYNLISPIDIPEEKELTIVFEFPNGIIKTLYTRWILNKKQKQDFIESKARKLNRIADILRCPTCESNKLEKTKDIIKCSKCETTYELNNQNYNFLTGELKTKAKVKPTENISANNYDEESLKIIADNSNGLILDNGSGLRGNYLENVLNFEIVDYPTTDVTGIGERLPFKDEAFDAALSLNVLEHVKNPFLYTNELKRVVKKGGTIYTAVPFLQPYHGYPYHFFNMTSEGLKVLFEDTDIIRTGEVKMGHPLFGISWILSEYLNGLSGKEKRQFSKLKVKNLIKDPSEQLNYNYAKKLSKEARNIISCVNFIVCKKI